MTGNRPAGPPTPLPLTFITGPLGAGKSRLINAITARPALAATVALANEPGRTPLASPLPPGDLPDMAGGCLCCTAQGMLARVLEDLLRKRDNHRMPPFDRLIIETAGEADPAAMAGEVLTHPYLSRRYAMTGIIALEAPGLRPEQGDIATCRLTLATALAHPDAAALLALPWAPAAWPEVARRKLFRLTTAPHPPLR